VFQIETKKTHELFISNQTINALRPLNVRTTLIPDLYFTRKDETDTYEGLRQALEKLQQRMGVANTKQQSFNRLIEAFKEEADR
jgi:hypothetical protein